MKKDSVLGNETLQLFWRVMNACGVPEHIAEKTLQRIEEKNNFPINRLLRPGVFTRIRAKIKLTDDEVEFLHEIKEKKMVRAFSRAMGMSRDVVAKAIKNGVVTDNFYEKFKKAKKKWRWE